MAGPQCQEFCTDFILNRQCVRDMIDSSFSNGMKWVMRCRTGDVDDEECVSKVN
jgi:hypothetical protein